MKLPYAAVAAMLAVLPLAVLPLAGCAGQPATGQVTGRLMSVSSRTQDKQPMAGTVTFVAPGQPRVTVQAGTSGNFSAQLPPGRYQVSGPCTQSFPVTVTADQTAHVTIYCIVRLGSPPPA